MTVSITDIRQSVTGLSHSGFYVDDLDRTIAFYQKILGAKLQWRKDSGRDALIKLYVGDFGLSIIKRPAGVEKVEIPHPIHFAYRAEPARAEELIEYIKSCDVAVEGPVGHGNEPENVSWFFLDPDGYRLEIEAHYTNSAQSAEVVERGKAGRQENMGLFGGDAIKHTDLNTRDSRR